MTRVIRVDTSRNRLDIHIDLSVHVRETRPGPPERTDGMTVGVVIMETDSPHGGEVHPDGDEILYVIAGKLLVTSDSNPDGPLELSAGEACVVCKGEWHNVHVIEKATLLHITPGPHGEARPR